MTSKNIILISLIAILYCNVAFCQNCPVRNFKTQEDIDNFSTQYPNCEELPFGISILEDSEITNLKGLSQLKAINGSIIIIDNPFIEKLDGLENITFIDEGVTFWRNENLQSIKGLTNLENVSTISIINNNQLDDIPKFEKIKKARSIDIRGDAIDTINTLSHLDSIEQSLSLGGENLVEITGFKNLNYVGGRFEISSIKIKEINGFNSLTRIDGDVILQSNEELKKVNGFTSLTYIGGELYFRANPVLEAFDGLSNLKYIGDWVRFFKNDMLKNLSGLKNLETANGTLFYIWNNNNLESLDGLSSLKSINGDLRIGWNPNLNSLKSLSSLESIDGIIELEKNDILQTLEGLQNIDPESIRDLKIFRCELLSDCSVRSICDYLSIDANTYEVSANEMNCDSKQDIQNNCSTTNIDESAFENINIFPNPVDNYLIINGIITTHITIYNSNGRLVENAKVIDNKILVNRLAPGLYFIQLHISSDDFIVKKMIKK